MRYSPNSHSTKELKLLDLAYLTVLPPILLITKLPMLIFMATVVYLIYRDKRLSDKAILGMTLWGLVAIAISMFGSFNFAGLSRLKVFVELIMYLLILAVSLQRLTKEINFYQIISPILLLAISLFFFHTLPMLIYVIFEIFVLLWIILAYRMQSSIEESLKMTGMLFLLSLPWVILLFIFFPRISFEHASYGFKNEEVAKEGYDGKMYANEKAVGLLSDRIVFEVGFNSGKIPPSSKLYFRGSVLYIKKGKEWKPMPIGVLRRYRPARYVTPNRYDYIKDIVSYRVSLYPTKKRWIYLLDLPIEAPTGAVIDSDFSVTLKGGVNEPVIYDAGSALEYKYGRGTLKNVLDVALGADSKMAPRCAKLGAKIAKKYKSASQRVKAILKFFLDQNLMYSLRPKGLDPKNTTDSFLFDVKQGYCVHFADSFALLCRFAKVPSRVVTGYKAKPKNSVKNYLAVKEKDAHAWVEVYIDNSWVRVDPTATAKKMDTLSMNIINQTDTIKDKASKINLYLLYIKYKVEAWILYYSHFRQMQLYENIKNSPRFALVFVSTLIVLFGIFVLFYLYLKKERCTDKALCILAPLLKRLEKEGYKKETFESISSFFNRYSKDGEIDIKSIDRLYHECKYKESKDACYKLKNEIKRIKKSV